MAIAVANTGLPLAIDPRALLISTVVVVGLALLGVAFTVWRVLRIDPFHAVGRAGLGGIE